MVEPSKAQNTMTSCGSLSTQRKLGFAAFVRSDHFLRIGGGDPGPGPRTHGSASPAWLGRQPYRLGTLMSSATFRLPGMLAVQVAEVDAMSGGRVELGIGAGWFETEHSAYGVPFPGVRERFDRFEEQLAIITGLWRTPEGERFSYDGLHYQLDDCPALPRPVQHPHPPIIIGGSGTRRTPSLAATYADEFNVGFQSVEVGARPNRTDAHRMHRGWSRPFHEVYSVSAALGVGQDEAQAAGAPRRAGLISPLFAPVPVLSGLLPRLWIGSRCTKRWACLGSTCS